ncbi:GTP pyrophosphokinase [Cronobacter turicensis]
MNVFDDFKDFLESQQDAFKAWGSYVQKRIEEGIRVFLNSENINNYLKIPVTPRLKEIESALGKVARKGYDNPREQMTDLVGIRFVVLLSENINEICNVLEKIDEFNATVSKNYLEEIDLNPKIFDYQSKHYEVRPRNTFELEGVVIDKSICCEVQIRTLLQHAYAELVHDNIYKPVGPVPKTAERQIARSMALMETTDDLFCVTMKLLHQTNLKRNDFLNSLKNIYNELVGDGYSRADEDTNLCVLDAFRDHFTEGTATEIRHLIGKKPFIKRKIRQRADRIGLFCQPVVLFVYLVANNSQLDKLLASWPLPGYISELNLILSDLGISTI